MNRLKDKTGFTLVEAVVSILILGLALGGMLSTFVMGRVGTAMTKHRTQAINLLRARMEEIKGLSYADIASEQEQVTLDAGPDLTRGTADDLTAAQAVTVTDCTTHKKVLIALAWTERSLGADRDASESLITYITW